MEVPTQSPPPAPTAVSEVPPQTIAKPPKKSSNMIFIMVAIVALLAIFGGAYYFLMNRNVRPEVTVFPSLAPQSSQVPLSSSDDIEEIEQDIDNTVISDDDSLYTNIESDLQGL